MSQHRVAAKIEARRDAPLEPGDLVLSTRSGQLAVEWLVLEKVGSDSAFVVAPVDTMALFGPADARLSREGTGGPVFARCAFAIQVPARCLSSRDRTGQVSAEALATARRQYRESLQADRLGNDPDYQDWIEDVVLPACERLLEEDRGNPAAVPVAVDAYAHRWIHVYRVAAAILLVVALAASAGWFVEHRMLERSAPGIESSPQPQHVPVVFLASGGQLRGDAESFALPEGVRRFVLVVFLDPARLSDRYRVEVTAGDGSQRVWRSDDVPRGNEAHLGLELPRLPNGKYTLRLYAPADVADSELIDELMFEIVTG